MLPSVDAFGVYVHIPFCTHRCDYCAFATFTDRHHLHRRYLDAVRAEIRRAVDGGMPPATTVFVGGGTPTLVEPEALVEVTGSIPVVAGAEITIEANPDTVTADSLRCYRDGGVNRVSIGVQSMVPSVLDALGRTHDPDNVRRAVEWTRAAGFPTFNLDIIYGAAGETVDEWEMTVDEVLRLEPPHVSAYGLTVEAGTPLADDASRHPDDDDQATKYEVVDDRLVAAGLDWYEVSNWARPGHESSHNRLYWLQADYRGVGSAAHSHAQGRRWWNVRTPDRYIDRINSGLAATSSEERLDDETRRIEGLQLRLRMREGIDAAALDLADPALDGLVAAADGRVTLTRAGRLLANEVAIRVR